MSWLSSAPSLVSGEIEIENLEYRAIRNQPTLAAEETRKLRLRSAIPIRRACCTTILQREWYTGVGVVFWRS